MVPSVVVKMERLPLTPNGKVDRGKLAGLQVMQRRGEAGGDGRERKLVEEMIAGIWEEVLGIDGVRLSDNFFEIGGH